MKKINIYVSDEQAARLAGGALRGGKSLSAVVRDFLDELLEEIEHATGNDD